MNKARNVWEKTDISQLTEFLYLITLGLYLVKLSFDTTMFTIPWPRDYEMVLLVITNGVVLVRLGYDRKCKGLRWLFCAVMAAAFGLSWRHTAFSYGFLLYIPALVIGAMDLDYKKILKASFTIDFATLALAFIASCSGAVRDLSYEAGLRYRHSFGIVYPTDFAARTFYLLLAAWILFDNIYIIVSIFTVIFSAWFIFYFCQARCSGTMILLLAVCMAYEYFTRKGASRKLPVRIIDRLCVWCAPVCAVFMICLSLFYTENVQWMQALDGLLTQRLSLSNQAINQHGFTFFGTAFAQEGQGGTTAYNFFYNFVDSSYVLIILRYGIAVFVLFLVMAVYQGMAALRANHRKLLLAGALVALHSAIEHHMPEVNYNIFLLLPFSVSSPPDNLAAAGRQWDWKTGWKKILSAAVGASVVFAAAPWLMRHGRTLVHLLEYHKNENGIHFILWCLAIGAAIWALAHNMKKMPLCHTRRKIRFRNVAGLALSAFALLLIFVISGETIQGGKEKYAAAIEGEKHILEGIFQECGQDIALYISDVPSLYKEEMAFVTDRVLPVEACDLEKKNVILITPIEKELNNLIQSGYYFGSLSDLHGIYTNSKEVMEYLNRAGIGMTDYYSVRAPVDMYAIAETNNLIINEDGSLFLSGREMSISRGPWISLSKGNYYIAFDIQLTRADSYELGVARVTTDNGRTWWEGRDITWADFDENGHGIISFEVSFWCDVNNAEFILLANDQIDMFVNNIEWRKTGRLGSVK